MRHLMTVLAAIVTLVSSQVLVVSQAEACAGLIGSKTSWFCVGRRDKPEKG